MLRRLIRLVVMLKAVGWGATLPEALRSIQANNAWTIEQQISLCEIAAPPFQEKERGLELKRRFEALAAGPLAGFPFETICDYPTGMTRRQFLVTSAATLAAQSTGSIIDIHQHTNYSGRTDEQLLAHQKRMGIAKTVLLPAGSKFGLAAGAGGNETVLRIVKERPEEYYFFANELPDIPSTRQEIEKYLKLGAIGIGEQKFNVECDSKAMQLVFDIAQAHGVPLLMHFQHGVYNLGIERFHKMLEKYPKVAFIGHAQTWWGNIDKSHDQTVMYPKTPLTAGGISDRLLSDYPNMYGDLSAGSGLNALLRDEAHARAFLTRHQDKLLYGSDCSDRDGAGSGCSGSQQIAAVRRLAPNPDALQKILYGNAARVLRIR